LLILNEPSGCFARKMYKIRRETAAAIILQKYVRRLLLQRNYQEACSAALLIQSCIRGFIARLYFSAIREQKAALVIQVYLLSSLFPPPPHPMHKKSNKLKSSLPFHWLIS
jgi:hypothetical protein